jgi:hypothetical protein
MSTHAHEKNVERLARYRAGKQAQPLDYARRWAQSLTEAEASELVELVDLIERTQAEHAQRQIETPAPLTDEQLAAERRQLGQHGDAFRRRLDAIADRLSNGDEPPPAPPRKRARKTKPPEKPQETDDGNDSRWQTEAA